MYYLNDEASEADEADHDVIDVEEQARIEAFEVAHNQLVVEIYAEEDAMINEAFMVAHELFIEEEAQEAAETAEVLYKDAVSRYESNTARWHDEWVLGTTLPVVEGDDRYTRGIRGLLFIAACFDDSGMRLTPNLSTIDRHTRRWMEIKELVGTDHEKNCFSSLYWFTTRFNHRLAMFIVEKEKRKHGDLLFRQRLQGDGFATHSLD
jgi:hypothetical protein